MDLAFPEPENVKELVSSTSVPVLPHSDNESSVSEKKLKLVPKKKTQKTKVPVVLVKDKAIVT